VIEAIAAPDGERTSVVGEHLHRRGGEITRVAISTTRSRFITEQGFYSTSRNLTPGISGAHGPLMTRGTLSARPLHAVVRRDPVIRRRRLHTTVVLPRTRR
jgi:hypothetical protein